MFWSDGNNADSSGSQRAELLLLLDELIALEHSLVTAYVKATRQLSQGCSRDQLLRFMDNHQQHVAELCACRQIIGGDPKPPGQQSGAAAPDCCRAHAPVSKLETLRTLWSGEGVAAQAYEEALGSVLGEPTVRSVLRYACQDTREHWTWIAFRVAQEHGTADLS